MSNFSTKKSGNPWQSVTDALDQLDFFWNHSHSYVVKDSGLVDDNLWHTITANRETAKWIRRQSKDHWYEHRSTSVAMFDVSDKLFLLLKVRWG